MANGEKKESADDLSVSQALRRLAFPVLLPGILQNKSNEVLNVMLPIFCAENLGLSATTTGVAVSLQSLVQAACAVPVGKLLARISCRKGLYLGGSALICAALVGFTSGCVATYSLAVTLLFASRILVGIGLSLWTLSRQTLLSSVCSSSVRGRVSALSAGVGRWGAVVAAMVGGLAAERFGNEVSFLVQGSFTVLAMLLMSVAYAMLPDAPARAEASREFVPLKTVCAKYGHVLCTIGSFAACFQAVRAGWRLYVVLQCQQHGLSTSYTASIIAAGRLVEGLVFPLGGYCSDEFGRVALAVPCMLLFSISFVAMTSATEYGWLLLSAVPYALGNGLAAGLIQTLGGDAAPAEARSEFLSAWRLATSLGQYSGPMMLGIVIDVSSVDAAGRLFAIICVCNICWLLMHRALVMGGNEHRLSGAKAILLNGG